MKPAPLCHFAAASAFLLGVAMTQTHAAAATPEEQLKDLQSQVAVLQQQVLLASTQQTQASAVQTAVLTAMKSQVTAQSEFDKAKAQSDFARLAGLKAGLESAGAPLGKEGAVTVTTGTAGALMLSLRKPMLEGLEVAASTIAAAVKSAGPAVYVGTDAQVQSALQASVTDAALTEATTSLDTSTVAVQAKLGPAKPAAAFFTEAAAAGLVLNTIVGLEKFFRVDTAYSVFDPGEEAQQVLMSMLQRKLKDSGVDYRNLSSISIPTVLAQASAAQSLLLALRKQYELSVAVAAEVDALKADDPRRASQDLIDRLKVDLGVAKAAIEALHPAQKPEAFWAYVQGCTARAMMQDAHGYVLRLVVQAKAQTIQVIEKRTWRSDKIFGKSDIQVEYRLFEATGALRDSGLSLTTFASGEGAKADPLYEFPKSP